MADFLVLYEKTDGYTAKIANVLAADLQQLGGTVKVADAAEAPPSPTSFRAVAVVVASARRGGCLSVVARWIRQHSDSLSARPTAFVSVYPGWRHFDAAVDEDVNATMASFFARTGLVPTVHKVVAGWLPYTRYNLLKRWVVSRRLAKAGVDTDTTRDYEYTDWSDLAALARTLVSLVTGKSMIVECPVPGSVRRNRRFARGA